MSGDLIELAERVEKASGPDVYLSREIALAVGRYDPSSWRDYSGSVDAAMSLVPEGCVFSVMTDFGLPGRARIWGSVLPGHVPDRGWSSDAATPALALTAACLRARSPLNQDSSNG